MAIEQCRHIHKRHINGYINTIFPIRCAFAILLELFILSQTCSCKLMIRLMVHPIIYDALTYCYFCFRFSKIHRQRTASVTASLEHVQWRPVGSPYQDLDRSGWTWWKNIPKPNRSSRYQDSGSGSPCLLNWSVQSETIRNHGAETSSSCGTHQISVILTRSMELLAQQVGGVTKQPKA